MAFMMGLEKVTMHYPTKKIFTQTTAGIEDGDRIGVVGKNGDGKSTLLQLLARKVEPDGGRITARGGLSVGILTQKDELSDEDTVEHAVVGDLPTHIWASNPKTRAIIAGLISDIPWDARVGTLSGGQRRRVDLTRLLIGDWDVLLLDEPTNHLDVVGIFWLAKHLKTRWQKGTGAFLVVTHDRWFLDEVCLNMWEVHDSRIEPFEGGFSAYIQQRVERQRVIDVTEQRRQNEIRKELAWLSRGARARATKPKFHVKAARELIAQDPPLRDELELKRVAMTRLGKQVLDFNEVSVWFDADSYADSCEEAPVESRANPCADPPTESPVTFGENFAKNAKLNTENGAQRNLVLDNITWSIGPGDRIGIIGANGAGKTTLLRLLEGSIEPSGGFIKRGKTVNTALLSQRLTELEDVATDPVRLVLKRCKQFHTIEGKEVSASKMLERMGFDSKYLNTRVCDLSGGQRRRLQLLMVLLEEPNVLIMDEPGNDMDIDMLAVMEDLLDSWPGTLILVTHDRFLMERVTDNQYSLMNGRLRHLPGGVDEYIALSHGKVWTPEEDTEVFGEGAKGGKGSAKGSKSASKGAKDGNGANKNQGAHSAGHNTNLGSNSSPKNSTGLINTQNPDAQSASNPTSSKTHGSPQNNLSNKEIYQLRKELASLERKTATARSKTEEAEAALLACDPSNYEELIAAQERLDQARATVDNLEEAWIICAETLGE